MFKTNNLIKAIALVLALGTITAGCRSTSASSDSESSYSSFISAGSSSQSSSSSATQSTDSSNTSQQGSSSNGKGQSGLTNKNESFSGQNSEIIDNENPSDPTPNNPGDEAGATANDTLLCAYNSIPFDKNLLLPSVAYMVDGEIKDTMFDSFGFTITSDAMYDYNPVDALKPLKKSDHMRWINTEMQSVKALNNAVEEVNNALGRPNYKVSVILCVVPFSTQLTSYGEVDGKDLNLTVMEDRKRAAKWFIDEKISQFNSGNYSNLELKGFYWVSEGLSSDNKIELIQYATDYIRSAGKKTFWAPYYCAPGYNEWQKAGFDVTALQANFFPPELNLPNSNGIQRLDDTIALAKQYNMGVELEMCTTSENSVTYYKHYLRKYVDTELLNKYHAYYILQGASGVKQLSQSKDSYIRSSYDETYKFIKKTLKSSEVIIR